MLLGGCQFILEKATGYIDEIAFGLWILGAIAISEQRYDEAPQYLDECLTIYQKNQKLSYIGRGFGTQGIYNLAVGNEQKAKQFALEALRIGIELPDLLSVCYAISTIARILVSEGKTEQAVTLHSMCLENVPMYKFSHGMETSMREPLIAAAKSLPPQVAHAALKRGEEMDFWETAGALLQEQTTNS